MSVSFGFSHWLVLWLVAAVQVYLLYRALQNAAGLSPAEEGEVAGLCLGDLQRRAQRGLAPDWLYYLNEIERICEPKDDRIRRCASAALAVGLGGTLLAIVLHFFLQRGGNVAQGLIGGLGVSLVGSLLGVLGNLLIVLAFLPRAERRIAAQTREIVAKLRQADDASQSEGLARTLHAELAGIRDAVSQQFTEVFASAVTGFPAVVDGLRAEVATLARVVESQGEGLGPATAELAQCANAVNEATRLLAPEAAGLAHAAALLADLPGQLNAVLDRRRDEWLEAIRDEQQERLDELNRTYGKNLDAVAERERLMLERSRELQAAVNDVNIAAGGMGEQFGDQIERVASRLGIEFGREARQHTVEIAERIESSFERLAEKVASHEQQWRNNLGVVIDEVLRGVGDKVNAGVGAELNGAASSLGEIAREIPKAAEVLRNGVETWNASQESALAGWRTAGQQVGEVSRELATLEAPLRASLEALKGGGERLGTALREVERLPGEVVKTLAAATADHLLEARKVQGAAERLLEESRGSQQRAAQVLSRQGDLIRYLLAKSPRLPGKAEAAS